MSDPKDSSPRIDADATSVPDAGDDPRVFAVVQEYMAAVEAGRRPNRRELIARHPDIAAELSECLQGLAMVESAAAEMERDAGGGASAKHVEDVAPDAEPLGDFRLVREIARGGMGVVYEAIQLSLGRRVALKVLPLAGALDPRQLQRFRNEAQAAAQLHHSNIVPVYAVGYERSVHFYAMQLIDGQSLAEVIQALRAARGQDGTASRVERSAPVSSTALVNGVSAILTTKRTAFFQTVARLGMQAAEALEYAHQLGVVHRDIKPANLLLDVHGTLWITDFGLAQLQSEAGGGPGNLTQPGDMLGTLRYMSPEQASGKAVVLDQRTDVYSLGLTLYELLTLERALPGETREQLLYQIDYVDPKPPRSIDRAIPVELETILAKATAKDPAERYASARAFADDLRRFLHNEPIQAKPPSLWDQAVKWTRRHRPVAVSAVAVLLLSAVALGISTILIQRAYFRERERATEARLASARADGSLRQALQAVDYFTAASEELPKHPQFLHYRRSLLDAALEYYQNFVTERRDDPAVRKDLDQAVARIGVLMADIDGVDQLMRLDLYKRMLADPAVREELKLTGAQASAADALVRRQFERERDREQEWATTRPIFEKPLEERPVALQREADAAIAEINAVLTAEQFYRLRQIARQARGASAFNDVDVAQALRLSKAQKATVQEALNDERDAMRGAAFREPGGPGGVPRPGGPVGFGGPGGKGPRGRGATIQRLQGPFRDGLMARLDRERDEAMAAAVAKVVATFDTAQRETWDELVGPPTKVRVRLRDEFRGLSGRVHYRGPEGRDGPPPHDGPPPGGPRPDGPPPFED